MLDANQAATILDKSVFAAEQNKAEQLFSGGEQLLPAAGSPIAQNKTAFFHLPASAARCAQKCAEMSLQRKKNGRFKEAEKGE